MNITTSRFGEMEVDESLIFNFIEPILGYEHLKKFVLVDHMPDSPFKWLQSVEDSNTAFPVTVPGYFNLDYQFIITEEDAKRLDLVSADALLTLNIVCIPQGNPEAATINLVGPLLINVENKKSMQLVLLDSNFSVKHRLFKDQPKVETQETEKIESKG